MTTAAPANAIDRYADWKAPPHDGAVLIWPAPPDLLADQDHNHRLLASADHVTLHGTSLPELRTAARSFLGHTDDAQPIAATGHQTELYHAGVWVKLALVDAIARRAGGTAVHFAVDTDEPKHLAIRWPGGSEPITDDPNLNTAPWAGLVAPPTPAHINTLRRRLAAAAAGWSFKPLLPAFIDTLAPLSLEAHDLPSMLTNATHRLDWDLGLRHHAMLTSPIWTSEPFLVFAYHLMARAGELADHYNRALADYRRRAGIKSPGRPMPDLRASADAAESPFWFDDLAAAGRQRLVLHRPEGSPHWTIATDAGRLELDPRKDATSAAAELLQFLRRHNLRLAPRALTLTTFLRLFVADQWVHGIGGGRYDQVADRIIQSFFGLEPPRFAVATATLYFPDAVGRTRACLPCIKQEGHRLRHALLGPHKMDLVRRIAEAPRRSTRRALLFAQMHQALQDAESSPAVRDWQHRADAAERAAAEDRVLFDRELFYAIQPRDRLEMLIARCRAEL
jgi:hypothetical protein